MEATEEGQRRTSDVREGRLANMRLSAQFDALFRSLSVPVRDQR
jgi:hypothetical protein